jgi:hypothetical protein
VFHEFAIPNAKHIEGEHFVPHASGRGRILPVVLVDDRDQIAFSGDDFKRISGWWLRAWRRLAAAWAARGRCLRRAAEWRLEVLEVAHPSLPAAFDERGIVLLVARVGQCDPGEMTGGVAAPAPYSEK